MKSMRASIETGLGATAQAGFGRLISAGASTADAGLGDCVYIFRETGWTSISLYDRGLCVGDGLTAVSIAYDRIDQLDLLPLRELVKLQGLDAKARLQIVVGDVSISLILPYKIYSPLSTLLLRLVEQSGLATS